MEATKLAFVMATSAAAVAIAATTAVGALSPERSPARQEAQKSLIVVGSSYAGLIILDGAVRSQARIRRRLHPAAKNQTRSMSSLLTSYTASASNGSGRRPNTR